MKLSKIRKGVVFTILSATLGLGCELIVDFDRTRIPIPGDDSSTIPQEASTIDAALDTNAPDAADAETDADAATNDAADAADAGDAGDAD